MSITLNQTIFNDLHLECIGMAHRGWSFIKLQLSSFQISSLNISGSQRSSFQLFTRTLHLRHSLRRQNQEQLASYAVMPCGSRAISDYQYSVL